VAKVPFLLKAKSRAEQLHKEALPSIVRKSAPVAWTFELDMTPGVAKLRPFPAGCTGKMSSFPIYDASSKAMATACKHPKVKVVARDEDAEYVECSQCGEVFDSSEFRDMQIEETVADSEEE
jgi:hypothetical protein